MIEDNSLLPTASIWLNSDHIDTPCLGVEVILTISLGYRNTTGCTGTPGMNAPAGKEGQKDFKQVGIRENLCFDLVLLQGLGVAFKL